MADINEPDSDNHSLHAQIDNYSNDESVHAARSQHNLSKLEVDIREEISGIATQVQLLSKILIDSDFCHNYLHTLYLFESL